MLKNKTAFLFDLDGTLVHSAPDLAVAVNNTLKELNKPTYPQSEIMLWVGNGARKLLIRALTGSINGEANEQELDKAFPIFMRHYEANLSVHSYLYDDVVKLLDTLQSMNKSIACVTNKPERFTLPLLKQLGIDHYFKAIVGGDTLPVLKPDPAPLFFACEHLGLTKEEAEEKACMIGDSANDIRAAKAAGMSSVALTYGYNQGIDLSAEGADIVIPDMQSLIHLLDT